MTKQHPEIEFRSAEPIERRDDGDDDDPLAAATEAVEELRSSVDEFRSQTDEKLTNELEAVTKRLDDIETKAQRPGASRETNEQQDLEQRAFSGFLRRGRESLSDVEVRALIVGDDTKGGYLAGTDFVADMIRDLVEISPVRAAARVGRTSKGSVTLPKRTAITNALWEGETEPSTESEPAFAQVEIPVFGMRTFTDVSVTLLEDADVDVEAELRLAFAEDFGFKEGLAFISGTGVKQPRGILAHPDVAFVANGHATNLQTDGLIDVMHALPAFYRSRGVWMLNGASVGAVRKLKTTQGDYIWKDSLAEGNPPTILGRPVIEAPDMPDIASDAFPIIFGDVNQAYRIYDRVELSVLRDPFTQAQQDMVRFWARRRVGGDVVKAEAIRTLKMST